MKQNIALKVLLITPPLTQLNTPYPATAYLTASLKKHGYSVRQYDLGIELINTLFTKEHLSKVFEQAATKIKKQSPNWVFELLSKHTQYISTIGSAMKFLRGEDNTLANRICSRDFLPEGKRFSHVKDLDIAFGTMGQMDMAKYLTSLYIEDLTHFIAETICPHFGLTRYAEKLCTYIDDFKVIEKEVRSCNNVVDELMFSLLDKQIKEFGPALVGFTIPFPGNFLSAIKSANHIKGHFPKIKSALGGGFINTELRYLSEPALFKYADYVLLDDGEDSLPQLCRFIEKKIKKEELYRTFTCDKKNKIKFYNKINFNGLKDNIKICPDFSGLPMHNYISMVDSTNPLTRIWNDGRWNKMIVAHGCYWGKCAFCDTNLPYIKDYSPLKAVDLVNNMEKIVAQTHQSGFHFVDEAAPPKLLKEMANELLKRELQVTWWGNIRFEKAFDGKLCQLMSKAGCIAVSGGIEVASDRVLKLINKGVTIEQAAKAAYSFSESGIMVHAYLMYGFPTQTIQETIDSLEIIRQFFKEGLIQSAFWHRYMMTIHSETGLHPEKYGAVITDNFTDSFARNDIEFEDGSKIDLDMLEKGLNKSLYNYMLGIGFDLPVHKWFAKILPATKVKKGYIKDIISNYIC